MPISSLLFRPHHLKIHKNFDFRRPFSSSVNPALDSCRNVRNLKQIHASIIVSNGPEPPLVVASKLTSLYILFNDFGSSVSVLKAMREPNTFLWNSLIKAHVSSGLVESAFLLYKIMRRNGVSCDGYTFPLLNKLILLLESSESFAEMIHCSALQMGFESDVYFCNTMTEAYMKSGYVGNALKLFDEMTCRDSVSWTSMISWYAYDGNTDGAFVLFSEMRKEVEPNEVTMIVMLQTCSNMFEGRQFHGYVIKSGFSMDQSLKNSVLKMYADFGLEDDSEFIFEEMVKRDVVSWNIMISWYSSKGKTMAMADCFNTMRAEVEPSIETLNLLISGFAACGNLCPGRQIHCLAVKSGQSDDIMMTSLLDLYAKSGDLETSTQLFREVTRQNCISWGAMISGLIENGYFEEAIKLFRQMVATGVQPVMETIRSLVVAYTNLGALRFGKAIHACFIKKLLSDCNKDNRSLETSIINMYIRCGNISAARICFDGMLVKDLVTWTSMIEGCGTHGLGSEAFELFHKMKNDGIEPNSVTFLSLLSACSHSGLLLEGCEVFYSMKHQLGIEPDLDHYTCIVDLLGRYGKIKEALSIILKMVTLPDSRIWAALLSAARVHEDQKVGKYAAEKLVFDLKSDNAGYFTLFSNVQASLEKWDEVEEVRNAMKDRNMMKFPGWSSLEVRGISHGFVSGDRSHNQVDEIYRMIECLSRNAVNIGNILL